MIIRKASLSDIKAIQQMADVVFRNTYADILSDQQMEYMINWMYSTESLTDQIAADGKEFFIAESDGTPAGYVSVERETTTDDGRQQLHLQKIYVMPAFQGKGVGKALFQFIIDRLKKQYPEGCRVALNVNRNNKAVQFYQHMGMRCIGQGDFDIGNGYYMNDYIYAIDI